MARLLVLQKQPGRGNISSAFVDGAPVGAMCSMDEYIEKFGGRDGWPEDFIIVDLIGMSDEEASDLQDPIVTHQLGPIDPTTGEPRVIDTIQFNSKGLILYNQMADTQERQDELDNNFRISRIYAEVATLVVRRGPP